MKNKRGFTLVELLAVIVILAIIALIVIPIVNGTVRTADEEGTKRSIAFYADAVQKSAMNHRVANGVPITGTFTSSNDGHTLTNEEGKVLNVDFSNSPVICDNVIIDETLKVELIGCSLPRTATKYSYFPNVSTSVIEVGNTPANIVSGTKDTIGSVIAIGSETFYVVSATTSTVDLLATKNITPTLSNPKQSDTVEKVSYASSVPFSYDTSNVKQYVLAYVTYLESFGVTVSGSGLPNSSLVEGLGCDYSNRTCDGAAEWVYSVDYWLQSSHEHAFIAKAIKHRTSDAMAANPDASEYNSYEANYEVVGIRPIITIEKSEIG